MYKIRSSKFTSLALILTLNFTITTSAFAAKKNNDEPIDLPPLLSSKDKDDTESKIENLFKIRVLGIKKFDDAEYYKNNSYKIINEELNGNDQSSLEDSLKNQGQIITGLSDRGSIDIRGQGASSSRNVQVLVDGVPMNSLEFSHYWPSYNVILPQQIEAIDILPGSGSVIFGNGTRGGVVNIRTSFSDNTFKPTGSLTTVFGDKKSTSYVFGFPVFNEKLFFRFMSSYQNSGKWKNWDQSNNENYTIQVKYKISDHQNLGYQYTNYEEDGQFVRFFKEDGTHTKDNEYTRDRKNQVHNLIYQGDFGNFSIDEQFFHSAHKWLNGTVNYVLPLPGNLIRPIKTNFSSQDIGNKIKLKYNYKGFFENTTNYVMVGNDTIFSKLKNTLNGSPSEYNKKTIAFFVMNNIFIQEATYLKTGFRYNKDTWDVNISNNGKYKNSVKNNTAFEVLLGHNFGKNTNVYVKAETGFTAPDILFTMDYGNRKYTANNLDYEKFVTYEIGAQTYIPTYKTNLKLSVFNTNTNNEIETIYGSASFFGYRSYASLNIGDTRRTGIDFSANSQITSKVSVFVNGTYMNTNLTKANTEKIKNISGITDADKNIQIENLKSKVGKQLTLIPNVSLAFGFDFTLLDGLTLKNTYKYISNYDVNYSDNSNKLQRKNIKGYMVSDLILYYNYSSFKVLFGFTNIFNNKYNELNTYSTNPHGTNDWQFRPGAGRGLIFGVKYDL